MRYTIPWRRILAELCEKRKRKQPLSMLVLINSFTVLKQSIVRKSKKTIILIADRIGVDRTKNITMPHSFNYICLSSSFSVTIVIASSCIILFLNLFACSTVIASSCCFNSSISVCCASIVVCFSFIFSRLRYEKVLRLFLIKVYEATLRFTCFFDPRSRERGLLRCAQN